MAFSRKTIKEIQGLTALSGSGQFLVYQEGETFSATAADIATFVGAISADSSISDTLTLISSGGTTVGQLAMRDWDNTNNVILSSTGGVIKLTGVEGLSSVNSYNAKEHHFFNEGHNVQNEPARQAEVCITGGAVISGAGINYYEPDGESIALSAKDIMVLGNNKRIVGHGSNGYLDIKSGHKTNASGSTLDNAASICMVAPGTTSASEIYHDAKSHNFRCDAGNTFLTLSAPAFDDSTPLYDRYGVAIIGGYAADHCNENRDETWRVNTTILGSLSVAAAPWHQSNDFGNATIDDNLEVCNKIIGHNNLSIGECVVNPNDRTFVAAFSSIATGSCAGIFGGQQNLTTGDWSAMLGGQSNTIRGARSTTIGGFGNEVGPAALNSGIIAGNSNYALTDNNLLAGVRNSVCNQGGGCVNVVFGEDNNIRGITSFSTIAGGKCNILSGGYGFIGSGQFNCLNLSGSNSFSSIVGGQSNTVVSTHATIGGGSTNAININSNRSFIGAGSNNTITGGSERAVIVGGCCHLIDGSDRSFIGGGDFNCIKSTDGGSFIGAGQQNFIGESARRTVIAGGGSNSITQSLSVDADDTGYLCGQWGSVIMGGEANCIYNGFGVLAGGFCNRIEGLQSSIINGCSNSILSGGIICNAPSLDPQRSTILGGCGNTIEGSQWSLIGGGWGNKIEHSSIYSSVVNGCFNNLSGSEYSSILGGRGNDLCGGDYSTVAGGRGNLIHCGYCASILGGSSNKVCNDTSVVLGGMTNVATHSGSFIAGTDMNTVSSRMFHAERLFLKADMLPTSDPGVPGVVWNDSGTLKISV